MTLVLITKERDTWDGSTEKRPFEDNKKVATCKPSREASRDLISANILNLGLPLSKTVKNKFLLFKPTKMEVFCYDSP